MKTSSIAAVVAITLLGGAAAWAQTAPTAPAPQAAPGKPGEHARSMPDPARAKEFCVSRYARAAGHLAYLEAKLDLTAAQKPLFQKWEQSVMGSAQKNRDACVTNASVTKPDTRPTILERETRMEKSLSEKLEALKAQRPALEALYASLTPDQQTQLNRSLSDGGRHGRMGGHQRMGGDHRPGRI